MSRNTWNTFGTRIGTRGKSLTSFRGTHGTRKCAGVCRACARAHVEELYPRICLFQRVPKSPGQGNHRRPTILDLKYSGDIAGLSDVVLLLFVPESDREEPTGEDQSIIGKIREGCKSPLACGLAPTALSSRRETTGQRPGLRKN
jgi:hypothetical protein